MMVDMHLYILNSIAPWASFLLPGVIFLYTIIIILVSVKGDKDMKTYITLTTLGNYIDIKELAVGEELILEKDKENQYDDEAIKVMVPTIVRKAM